MFTAALFITSKEQKQSKHPSTDEWINKRWSIHTMEYYSTIKRNETHASYNLDEAGKHYC